MTETVANGLPVVYQEPTGVDHFIDPPKRRIGALGVVLSTDGQHLLMVRKAPVPGMSQGWNLIGCSAEANEDPSLAVARGALSKMGVQIEARGLLVMHQMPATEYVDEAGAPYLVHEGHNYVFDCGRIELNTQFVLGPKVIGHHWFPLTDLGGHLDPFMLMRVQAALRALASGKAEMLVGHPQ